MNTRFWPVVVHLLGFAVTFRLIAVAPYRSQAGSAVGSGWSRGRALALAIGALVGLSAGMLWAR